MLGGRWYIFGFYEGYRYPQSTTIYGIVPSATLKAGNVIYRRHHLQHEDRRSARHRHQPRRPGDVDQVRARRQRRRGWVRRLRQSLTPNTAMASTKVGLQGQYVAAPQQQRRRSSASTTPSTPSGTGSRAIATSSSPSSPTSSTTSAASSPATSWAPPPRPLARPLVPWYLVTGLTTNITANMTNDFHYNYLRNFWQWGDQERSSSGLRPWRRPGALRRKSDHRSVAVQRQHPGHPHPLLGWAGPLLQRQRHRC